MRHRYHALVDGIEWAASAMAAARTRLDAAAENLANVSTVGFARIDVRERLGPFGVVVRRVRSTRSPALVRTGRELDLAIVGNGSFRVAGRDGIVSSRDGRFERERDGTLRDPYGRTLLDVGGRPFRSAPGEAIDPLQLGLPAASRIATGFVASGGGAIGEMVDVLAAERAFESAQKVVSAIDATREKSAAIARIT